MKYKVGDKVRVKSWEELSKIGVHDLDGDIKHRDGVLLFVTRMKFLCGNEYIIESNINYNSYYLEGVNFAVQDWMIEGIVKETPKNLSKEWTGSHYDFYYNLTEEDIKKGKIKLDPYFVGKQWKIGSKDDSGILVHQLKTIARFGSKNDIKREVKALYEQAKRMMEIYEVDNG